MAPTASTEEIRRCYHALALQLHPDKASEEQVCSLDDGRLAPLTPFLPSLTRKTRKNLGRWDDVSASHHWQTRPLVRVRSIL